MDWLLWSFIAACALAGAIVPYVLHNPSFWTLVARNPDFALALLKMEGCLVDEEPEAAGGWYAGPFRIRTIDRILHTVYMPETRVDRIESKVSAILKTTRRAIPRHALSQTRDLGSLTRSRSL